MGGWHTAALPHCSSTIFIHTHLGLTLLEWTLMTISPRGLGTGAGTSLMETQVNGEAQPPVVVRMARMLAAPADVARRRRRDAVAGSMVKRARVCLRLYACSRNRPKRNP